MVESNFDSFINELNTISSQGSFNVRPKLKPVTPRSINIGLPNLPPQQNQTGGVPTSTGNVSLDRLMAAIKGKESGGRYGVVNEDSGALGAYQVLWSNLAANNGADWDRQALGRDVSRDEYLNSPAIQDAIARYKLGEYLRKYGAAGAAATWYGGDWGRKNMHSTATQTGGYPSMYAYWTAILNSM